MPNYNNLSDQQHYTKNLAISSYLVAHRLMSAETNKGRKDKMKLVLKQKRDLLNEAFTSSRRSHPKQFAMLKRDRLNKAFKSSRLSHPYQFAMLLNKDIPSDEAKTLFIDLAFSNPFSPYELKYGEKNFAEALKKVGERFDVTEATISSILQTKQDAIKAHRNVSWLKVAGIGAAGVVVLGLGGYALAPVLAAKLGVAAGLSGIAASSHGLALLGGGTLAAGGGGMAGGLWLVTTTSAAMGGTALGGGTLLYEMGAAGAQVELTKLQVTYKEVLIQNQLHGIKAQEVIKKLSSERDELKKMLKDERRLNDKNAKRVQEMEEKLDSIINSILWMEDEAA